MKTRADKSRGRHTSKARKCFIVEEQPAVTRVANKGDHGQRGRGKILGVVRANDRGEMGGREKRNGW